MRGTTEKGPLWPYMLVAKVCPDGYLQWRYQEHSGTQDTGEWVGAQAEALLALFENPRVSLSVKLAAQEAYRKEARRAFNTATEDLWGPGWDL